MKGMKFNMVTRKKRRALLISIITIFILILATVFALLYFTTDSFKSNQTLFIKYMGKTEENYNWIEETIKNNEPSSIIALGFEYHNEDNKPQHTLPFIVKVELEPR